MKHFLTIQQGDSMKTMMTVFVSLCATVAMAKDVQPEINRKALEIFIKNSGQMATVNEESGSIGETGAALLAQSVTTGGGTHNKVGNTCKLDAAKKVFKCTLSILNSDDNGQTESAMRFSYELDQAADGMPSDKVRNKKIVFELFG